MITINIVLWELASGLPCHIDFLVFLWYNSLIYKITRIEKHTSNQRLDFLHKESTKIANSYDIVCVETLDMKSMSNKGFGNGKATMDNGYGNVLKHGGI